MRPAESQHHATASEQIVSVRNPLTDITNRAAQIPTRTPSANLTASQQKEKGARLHPAPKRKVFDLTAHNQIRKREGKRVVRSSKRLRRANGEPSSTENELSTEN